MNPDSQIAAIAGSAVAGGLELVLWCDLRVADETTGSGRSGTRLTECSGFGMELADVARLKKPDPQPAGDGAAQSGY